MFGLKKKNAGNFTKEECEEIVNLATDKVKKELTEEVKYRLMIKKISDEIIKDVIEDLQKDGISEEGFYSVMDEDKINDMFEKSIEENTADE